MIRSFRDAGVEDIFNGENTKDARAACPRFLWKVVARKLDLLDSAASLADLRIPPGNHLEALRGEWQGRHSIRVDQKYRICFIWTDKGPDQVEIVDYHR